MGAPYENGNIGSIYIYSGSTLGLTLTQKIMAQDISSNLRGFGISIARGADIDMNKYVGKCFDMFHNFGRIEKLRIIHELVTMWLNYK